MPYSDAMTIKLPERFEDGLGYLIHQLMFLFRQGFARKFNQAGLSISPEEMITLVVLKQNGPLKPTELASILAKDKAVITRALDHLNEEGLLRRVQDTEDRRAIKVNITKKGEQVFQRFFPLVREFICQILSGVSQKDYDVTRKVLSKMIENCKDLSN